MEGRLVHLDFSAVFYKVNHRGMLYKLRSIGVGGQFLFIVPQFLNERRQCVHLDGTVSALVGVIWGVPQATVLGPLLCILCTSKLFRIVGNHIVDYADDNTMYAVILKPLSLPQVMESLNQVLATTYSWCLKRHRRLNPKKTISMVLDQSRIYAPGYGDFTLGGAELEKTGVGVFLGLPLTLS